MTYLMQHYSVHSNTFSLESIIAILKVYYKKKEKK